MLNPGLQSSVRYSTTEASPLPPYWRDRVPAGGRTGAPDSPMRDIDQTPAEESPYECFECGNVVLAADNPGQCPDCAGAMRNRRTPIE